MKRSLVLGGLLGAAVVLASLARWGIDPTGGASVLAADEERNPPPEVPAPGPRLELEDPGRIAAGTLPSPESVTVSERRVPVAPRLVDASARKTGVDLNGTIRVLGGETRNLPPLKLTFHRDTESLDALAVEGEYLLPGIEPGRWTVSAEEFGYRPLSIEVDVDREPRHQRVDLTLERLPYVFVTVTTPGDEPLQAALRQKSGPVAAMSVFAVATLEPPRERLGATLEEDCERYGIGKWRPFASWNPVAETQESRAGFLELPRPMPVYVSVCVENVVLRTRYVPASAETVGFVISPEEICATRGSLRLRIVDADTGAPITEGRVGLHANGRFGMGKEIIQPDGTVEFPDLAPGPRNLAIVCRGYEWVVEQVCIEAGRETDLGVLRLSRPVSIEGTAIDADGQPVRAWVSVWPVEEYDAVARIADKFCWRADAEGRFSVKPTGRRRYLVRANDEVWSGEPVLVDTRAGAVHDVRLPVARGTPLVVAFHPGTPRGAWLRVRNLKGQPIAERTVDPERPAKISLAPGRYRAQVVFDEAIHDDREVEVAGGAVSISLGP